MDNLETVLTYNDLEGNPTIEVREVEGEGMAGEPCTFSYVYFKGEQSTLAKVKPYMTLQDYTDLHNYLSDVASDNYNSAISFIQ